jgi:hypothetical protein
VTGTYAAPEEKAAMNLKSHIVLAVGCVLSYAVGLNAHAAPAPQQKPAAPQQQPAQKPPAESNPFPEDTSSVPVVPTTSEPAPTPAPVANGASAGTTSLLRQDTDPAHSPDDPVPDMSGETGFSSSLAGTSDINIPDEEKPTAKRKRAKEAPAPHQETAKEDEEVAAFELGRKNWRAALSRYQSALVTDPENPDVYWGIAEAQRQLGDFANAKANYLQVVAYDPDSKHAKEAKKWLKDPQIANAPTVSKNQPQQ